MSEIAEVELRSPSPHVDVDNTMFVALGKDVKEGVTVLMWALYNSGGRKICILHIHQPARMIPMMGTKVSISLLDEHIVCVHNENERKEMQKILDKYVRTCGRAGVQVETLNKEMDSIEKGIVQLISQLGIKWLVMGAGASKSYSRGNKTTLTKIFFFRNSTRKMTIPKSKKATYVHLNAPSSCRISFIWEGGLIHTRESEVNGINIETESASLQASPDAETMQSPFRSLSVTEGQNDRLNLSGSVPNYRRVRSNNLGMRFSSLPDGSGAVTSRSRLNPEGSSDQDSPSMDCKVDGIHIEMESASLQASPNAETTQSFLRSLSVKEGKNDRLNLPDSARNYRRVRSSDLWMSLLSLPDGSSGVTPQSRLNPEASTNQDSPSRRSPLVGSLYSTCPSSEIIEDTSSVSLPSTEENEIWLEFPMAEYNERGGHRHSSFAVSSFEDLYHRYAQFVAKVESFRQDAHEESIRCKKAENDVIDAIGRAKASATMYADLLRHRIEIEESLERSKEEVEEMKCELVAVMNAHQSQIADSGKMVEELEQKLFSAVELLHIK
ncbi:U-box domain-containing protein 33-like [Forsythia ovata]|uniref:RING-type E3 ubiquitin transferase n=1 Tax=Forsythia ovata TaxID=205694 RepID=A0ABD1QRB1_9LAMI